MQAPLIAILDSGINPEQSIFTDADGRSRILVYYDMETGRVTNNIQDIPITFGADHGTRVAYAALTSAPESAELIIVRLKPGDNNTFTSTASILVGIEYSLQIALKLNRPLIINLSLGSNNGSHDGNTLFEQYINNLTYNYRVTFIVAAGNYGDAPFHSCFNQEGKCPFYIGKEELGFNLYARLSGAKPYTLSLIPPGKLPGLEGVESLSKIKLLPGYNQTSLPGYDIYWVTSENTPYFMGTTLNLKIRLSTTITPPDAYNLRYIWDSIWSLAIETPVDTPPGDSLLGDLWIYEPGTLITDSRFISPTYENTITVPGTATGVITVGSVNPLTSKPWSYSGKGPAFSFYPKPDILSINGGGINENEPGTSFSAPYVAGLAARLITTRNDPFLYGERMRAALLNTYGSIITTA